MGRFHQGYRQLAGAMSIRIARPDEAPALAKLINAAFVVEAFFKSAIARAQTSHCADGSRRRIPGPGSLRTWNRNRNGGTGTLTGCVYLNRAATARISGCCRSTLTDSGKEPADSSSTPSNPAPACSGAGSSTCTREPSEKLTPYYRRLGYVETELCRFRNPNAPANPVFS